MLVEHTLCNSSLDGTRAGRQRLCAPGGKRDNGGEVASGPCQNGGLGGIGFAISSPAQQRAKPNRCGTVELLVPRKTRSPGIVKSRRNHLVGDHCEQERQLENNNSNINTRQSGAGEIIGLSVVVNSEWGFEKELRELRYVW